jgi:hypothetical protein
MERLQAHPLWKEINFSVEKYQEVPCSRMVGERSKTGCIDLLSRNTKGWRVIDFRVDSNRSVEERSRLVTFVHM